MSRMFSFNKSNRVGSRRVFGTLLTFALLACVQMLSMAPSAFAGGFQLSVETPSSTVNNQTKDAVLIVRTYGCHQPADAKLNATAEGLVRSGRKSIPIELSSIGSGVYAIKQQWPSEGKWVLAFTGAYNGMTYSVMVDLGTNGKVFPGTRLEEGKAVGIHAHGARRAWVAEDFDGALKSTAGTTTSDADAAATSASSPLGWLAAAIGATGLTIGVIKRSKREDSTEQLTT